MKNNIKFTLIELLVVIAIIAILASILMPALSSARKRAKTTTCTNNMKTVMLGYQQYGDQFDGITPLSMFSQVGMGSYSFLLRVLKYQTNFKASHCPETNPLGYSKRESFLIKTVRSPTRSGAESNSMRVSPTGEKISLWMSSHTLSTTSATIRQV